MSRRAMSKKGSWRINGLCSAVPILSVVRLNSLKEQGRPSWSRTSTASKTCGRSEGEPPLSQKKGRAKASGSETAMRVWTKNLCGGDHHRRTIMRIYSSRNIFDVLNALKRGIALSRS